MSNQRNTSDLLVDLSTNEQQILTGGRWVCRRCCRWIRPYYRQGDNQS
jgi:hypothetical protein